MNRSTKLSRLPRVTGTLSNIVWCVVAFALAVGILVGSASAGSASSTSSPSPSPSAVASPAPSDAPAWLSAVAASIADQNSDASPAASEWAFCSVKQAASLMGTDAGEIPADLAGRQCYVVVLRGHFVDTKAFVPAGRAAPEGNCIVCVVSPATHQVEGFCLWPDDLTVDTSAVSSLAPLTLQAN